MEEDLAREIATKLEAAIIEDPTNDAPFLVYGDWLAERGDPQGSLIALMHAAATTAPDLAKKVEGAVRKYRESLDVDRGIALSWRLGFVETIRVISKDQEAWSKFLSTGAARFAQKLELATTSGHLLAAPGATLPTSLRHIHLKGNRVADLAPLANLHQLRMLVLEQTTKVRDLAPLAGLARLEHLDASGARAADLTPLASLRTLKHLQVPTHSVKDLSPLRGLALLEELGGRIKLVTDLSPLAALPKLRKLELGSLERTREIGDLAALTDLEELSITYREAPLDLTPIAKLTRLRKLNLNGSNVTDLGPIRGLTNLTELSLQYTKVSDLTPLSGLTALSDLDIRFVSTVSNVAPLHGLKNLKTLDVVYTAVLRPQRRALMEALPELQIWPNLRAD